MGSNAHQQEAFVLRWDMFQSNVASSFHDLRLAEDFFDVTVACDEQHQLRAHRVILAAASGYFRNLLRRNPATHPVVVMPPTVSFTELAHLIDFMYHGEVNIMQEEIDSFMALAQMLKVKGLIEEQEKPELPKMPKLPPGINVRRQNSDTYTYKIKKSGRGEKRSAEAANMDVDTAAKNHANPEDYLEEFPHDPQPSTSGQNFGQEVLPPHGSAPTSAAPAGEPAPAPHGASGSSTFLGLRCPQCKDLVPNPELLHEHMATAHGIGEAPSAKAKPGRPRGSGALAMPGAGHPSPEEYVTCNVCDKQFKGVKNLNSHQRRVHKMGVNPDAAYGQVPGNFGEKRPRGRPRKHPIDPAPAYGLDSQAAAMEGSDLSVYYEESEELPGLGQRPQGQVCAGVMASEPGTSKAMPSGPRGPQRLSKGPVSGQAATQGATPPPLMPSNRRTSGTLGSPQASHGDGSSGMDLNKLGKRFGGQISISSSDQPGSSPSKRPGGVAPLSSLGVSITKMKGGTQVGGSLTVEDAAAARRLANQDANVHVKEEPQEAFDDVENLDDDFRNLEPNDSYDEAYGQPDQTQYEEGEFQPEEDEDGQPTAAMSQEEKAAEPGPSRAN